MAILNFRTKIFSGAALTAFLLGAALLAPPAVAASDQAPRADVPARQQVAQLFGRPQGSIPDEDGYQGGGRGGGGEAAQLLVRIDRLENQMRSMNGQIEQLQFANRRLEDALKKFQQDVDFRFQDSAGGGGAHGPAPRPPQKRGDIDTGTDYASAAAPPLLNESAPPAGRRRGDAFDPASDPNAPGAPRTLGQLAAATGATDPIIIEQPSGRSGPLPAGPIGGDRDPNAPLDLMSPAARTSLPPAGPAITNQPVMRETSSLGARPIGLLPPGAPTQTAALPPAAPTGLGTTVGGQRVTPGGTILAGLPPAGTKEEFDLALVSLNNGQYEAAETGFRGFLDKHPKDRLVPDAVFYLGDSYWKRGRSREAAEQYLKVSTDYSKSARAPESLVRLGLALEKLGAKEQACATLGEVGRKYPGASAGVRNAAERESKRLSC